MDIKNCEILFECPKKWANLNETLSYDVRSCDVCNKNVYLCSDIEDLKIHSKERHCVALKIKDDTEERQMMGDIVYHDDKNECDKNSNKSVKKLTFKNLFGCMNNQVDE